MIYLRTFLLYLLAFTSVIDATAQQRNAKITGRLVDAVNGEPLEGGTVTVVEDSSGLFISYAISNRKGHFTVSGLPLHAKLAIGATINGYRDIVSIFTIKDANEPLQTGDWKFLAAADELDSVLITARLPPFAIRNDTLEFNAASFQSRPNEIVEDLLKKLPGVRIDEKGTVYVHGKKVDRVLVDGREFFRGDLKMATQNLPGQMIDKVQVTETKDPAREFSSVIKPLTTTVTMNLTLRKESKKSFFGNVTAVSGTRDRYHAGAFLNSFDNEKRLSFNGSTGNGPSLQPGDGGHSSGIIRNSTNLALNYNDDIGSKGDYSLNYGFNSSNSDNLTLTERINLIPDNSFLYNSATRNNGRSSNHSLQGKWNFYIDSLQKLEGSVSLGMLRRTTGITMDASSETIDGNPINTQQNLNQLSISPTMSYETMINYNRFSKNRKAVFTVNWQLNSTTDHGAQLNLARNGFATGEVDSLDQRGNILGRGTNHNLSVNFNQSVGKNLAVILNYNFKNRRQNDEKRFYRFNKFTSKYDELDSLYSNHLITANGLHQATARLGYKTGKFAAELSAVLLSLRSNSRVMWRDSLMSVRQNNVSPNAAFSYTFNRLMQFIGNYSLSTIGPSADQLNPVIDITNPLVARVGNPLLRSGIFHTYNANFNLYSHDMKWRSAAGFVGSFVEDRVVEDVHYDSLGRQVISFRNVDGNHSYGINWNGGVQLQLNNCVLSIEMNTVAGNNIAVGFINGERSTSKTTSVTPSLNLQFSYKSIFNTYAIVSYEGNRTTYSLPDILPVNYNIKQLQVVASVSPVKKAKLTASLFHTYNSQLPPEFQRTRTYMSAGLTADFLKNERLTAGLSVNDLLNNNVNITRTVSPTAIETTQINALKRYAVVFFNYRLSDFK